MFRNDSNSSFGHSSISHNSDGSVTHTFTN